MILLNNKSFCQIDCSSGRFDHEVFASVDITNNILYGTNINSDGNNNPLTMDIYQPHGDTMQERPLIIWAHGGSFLSGTKNDADVDSLCVHFAKRGYVCATINYRLGIPLPVNQDNAMRAVYRAVQDMKASVRFFRKDAATTNNYQINSNIIYAGGSSAGAFTALHLAYLDEYSELPAALDTAVYGDLEGNSGNPGYSSHVNAVIDLCGALGFKTWMHSTDVPFVAMHGNADNVVPYGTAIINLLGLFPLMYVDGSYSLSVYADSIGLENSFYTFFGADHVPYYSNTAYLDTTVRFVSNFLYRQLGCSPDDPQPVPNTFTGINELTKMSGAAFFPNPSNGNFHIDIPGKKENSFLLNIYGNNGNFICAKNNIKNNSYIDLKKLKAGIYNYTLSDGKIIYSGRIIILN